MLSRRRSSITRRSRRAVPILTKANTFDRFPIDQLCAEGAMADLADVLTSSGHGGRFSFGLSTRRQHADAPAMIDYALDAAFAISRRRTLVVNCLPMGVGFSSASATVATTSVREDMATALVTTFGSHYDQIVLVTDPLFVRRLLDHAQREMAWTGGSTAWVWSSVKRSSASISERTWLAGLAWTSNGPTAATSCRRSASVSSVCTWASKRLRRLPCGGPRRATPRWRAISLASSPFCRWFSPTTRAAR